MSGINGIKPPFIPIGGINGPAQSKPLDIAEKSSFHEILKAQMDRENGLNFSAHAQSRMRTRNLELDAGQVEQLINAVDAVAAKGAHESLILLEETAFIVNVDKRTVITAMDKQQMDSNVFTNIDSAMVIHGQESDQGNDGEANND